MQDPTYDKDIINSKPVWAAAFILSEWYNDSAPIGWSRYIPAAESLDKAGLLKEVEDNG